MELSDIAVIIGLIATIPVYKGWAVRLWLINKRRKIKSLENQLEFISKLKTDNHALILYCGQAILMVAGFVAASLMFEIIAIIPSDGLFPNDINLSHVFISIMALISYMVAVYKLGILHKVKEYDKTCSEIEAAIEKYKT